MDRVDAQMHAALALLGLTDGATVAQATAAYRRLARATHPDRCTDPAAAERFAAVNAAYQRVLTAARKSAGGAPEPTPAPPAAGPRRRQPVQFAAGPVHYEPSPRTESATSADTTGRR